MKNRHSNPLCAFVSFIFFTFFVSGITKPLASTTQNRTDLIIYSYNRPMQLFALLESIEQYVSGLDTIFIIYRASSDAYEGAYRIVNQRFHKNIHFLTQTEPYDDLKELTRTCFLLTNNPYFLFGVDDIIVKDHIDLNECINALEKHNAHGFFFRLGKNLDFCYAMNCMQPLPPLKNAEDNIYSWQFNEGHYDWNYPNNLDFTLYCKSDFIDRIESLAYRTPNALESQLMGYCDQSKKGLCYASSKIINFPLNVVQKDFPNNCDNSYSITQLLDLFNKGLKIDIKPIHQLSNKSAHTGSAHLIQFIPRAPSNEKFFVIVTPSYNNKDWWEWNLKSLINQDYTNYTIIITDDCSTDGTAEAIANYIQINNLEYKVKLIQNKERRCALHNLYTMIQKCPNEAIIVTVDGDDALYDPTVLKKLNQIYSSQDVWLTYGQFIEYPSGTKGWCSPIPAQTIYNNAFRDYPDLPSHLRTFYAWLFKSIKLEDMLYYGEFYRMTWDYVMMLPMIEMAGERHLCIQDLMYIYNNANSISDHKMSRQLQAHLAQIVRAKKRYDRLSAKPERIMHTIHQPKADMILFAHDCNPDLVDQCLLSITTQIEGIGNIFILYLPTEDMTQRYYDLQNKYPNVLFFEISSNKQNFKELLASIYYNLLTHDYIIFGVPNMIIEQPINICYCIKALEETPAFAFSLRLSKENPYCPIPARMPLLEIADDLCAWNYAKGNDVWACANNVDMTLYRRNNSQISHILEHCWMYSWRDFVGWWAHEGNLDKIGLCFKYPKMKKID